MPKTALPMICVAALLQGCATSPVNPLGHAKTMVAPTTFIKLLDQDLDKVENPSPSVSLPSSSPAPITPAPVIVTTMMRLKDKKSDCTGSCRRNFAGNYTRLVLTNRQLPGAANDEKGDQTTQVARYNPRNPVYRFLLSKASGISLVAHVSVPGTLKTVAPLVSLSRLSNSDGESWMRELVLEKIATPHFLVKDDGSNSSVSVVFEAKASDSYASRGLAVGVSALSKLASTAGVNPPLITSLNKDSVRNLATDLDSAISRLLATSITEKVEIDRSLVGWGDVLDQGLSLSFFVPKDLEGIDMRESNLQPLGTWHVHFETPRPSIFVDKKICTATATASDRSPCLSEVDVETGVGSAANLASVLSYPVGGSGDIQRTVKSHMRQTEWWASITRDWGASTDPTFKASVMTGFCKQVISEAAELGFSAIDARLILAAIIELVPLPSESDQLRKTCAAISLSVPKQGSGT